jgi:hypothetical protein
MTASSGTNNLHNRNRLWLSMHSSTSHKFTGDKTKKPTPNSKTTKAKTYWLATRARPRKVEQRIGNILTGSTRPHLAGHELGLSRKEVLLVQTP